MSTVITALLPILWPTIVSLLGAVVAYAAGQAVSILRAHAKVAQLAILADIAGQALQAAVTAAGETPGKLTQATMLAALGKAKQVVLAHAPEIEQSLGAELDVVLFHHIQLQAGQGILAPGGAVVNPPTIKGE